MKEITFHQLLERSTTVPQKINIELLCLRDEKNPYQRLIQLIDRAFDYIAQDLSRNPGIREEDSEDRITIEIVSILKAMGFYVSHDTMEGGHCDILIEQCDNMVWLAEAKKVKGAENRWIYKGFEQLNTRYSTGLDNQNHGGVILYCFVARIDQVMEKWKEYIKSEVKGIVVNQCPQNSVAFRSVHTHERTGNHYHIRHLPISIYFSPKDRDL